MGVLLNALMDAEKETEKYEIIAKDVTEMFKVMTDG